ncbi:dienelactone hydrolase family protein [Brevundimonas sp.]|uniref:dienelactone hydrolase family protein n=1 Tax=Brevundimonas sp. TaxID=1871086 RepID=UPI00356249B7
MRRRDRLNLLAASLATATVLGLAGGSAAIAQAPQAAQVGVPGCADDVAVRASRELITFRSRGRPVRAYLYTPRGEVNGAGVVMLHGGTGFEMNAILFDAHAIQLASRGYRVILPAYFDAAAPDPRRRTVNARAWRETALDAARRLAAEPGVSPGHVALWGYSRGAGVAVDAAASDGNIRSAVIVAGGGRVDEPLGGRDLSFLLLHARSDEAVPVRATLDLADSLRAAGAAVEVQALDFDGHQYDLPAWCSVMALTRAFVEARRERSPAAPGAPTG